MAADSEALKDILIQTVANNHPNIPNEISESNYGLAAGSWLISLETQGLVYH